jgi:pyrimidine-nucleoside phosphorylase
MGHTGGTLDNLETIPGFRTQLKPKEFADALKCCGAGLIGQTPEIVPADRVLYALRDHTGTVESPYLITASIMSKKLAEDLNALVLDVKVGCGAFMPTYEDSKYLAELMVRTGGASGTRTVALLTSMDQPLGRFSGNWVEVWECVDVMKQIRHPMSSDLIELSTILAGWMLHMADQSATPEEGARMADDILRSGEAYKAWLKIVEIQGGDCSVFDEPGRHHRPGATEVFTASRDGYLTSVDCKQVGWAVQRLGAGRACPGDPVSAHAGIESHVKLGDSVSRGQALFTLFSEDAAKIKEPMEMLGKAIRVTAERIPAKPLVREVVTNETL